MVIVIGSRLGNHIVQVVSRYMYARDMLIYKVFAHNICSGYKINSFGISLTGKDML